MDRMDEQGQTRVIRNLGAGRTHVADVPAGLFVDCFHLGGAFVGAQLPIVTRCGTELRGRDSAAVCMNPGTRVTCSRCRRLTGIERAADGNNESPVSPIPRTT